MKIGYLMQSGAPEMRRPPYSGPANHVRQVMHGLRELGHQVRLLAQYGEEIWESDDLERYTPIYLPAQDHSAARTFERVVRRVQQSLQFPYLSLFESIHFAQACQKRLKGVDILYERLGWFGYGGGLSARRLQVPLVCEINGDLLSELELLGIAPRGLQRKISIHLFQQNLRRASGFVAAGAGWGARFTDRWQVSREKISVVENGSEVVHLLDRQQLRSFRSEADRGKRVSLVFVGGFDPWQGLDILVQAFQRAVQQGADLHLSLIGAGNGFEELSQMVRRLDLDERVTFHGWLSTSETARLLAQADIGVSPYCGRSEFTGLKLYDYKAAGLAIIASGTNGEPKTIQHGHSGWIVLPGDPVALSEAILHLGGDPVLRRRLGQAARIDAEVHHTWEQTAAQIERVLTHFVAG